MFRTAPACSRRSHCVVDHSKAVLPGETLWLHCACAYIRRKARDETCEGKQTVRMRKARTRKGPSLFLVMAPSKLFKYCGLWTGTELINRIDRIHIT